MGSSGWFSVVLVLLLKLLGSFGAAQVRYLPVGGDLVLDLVPGTAAPPGFFTDLIWKLNRNLVAEWSKDQTDVDYYGDSKNRTTLDPKTGQLQIRRLEAADSGTYTVDINNQVNVGQFQVQVILKVPELKMWISPLGCSEASERCTLDCGLDLNLGNFGPLTYTWKVDPGPEWVEAGPKRVIINNNMTRRVPEFQCRIKNPVSESTSGPLLNPFFRREPEDKNKQDVVISVVGVTVGVIYLIVIVVWKLREKKRREKERREIQEWFRNQQTSSAAADPQPEQLKPLTPQQVGAATSSSEPTPSPQDSAATSPSEPPTPPQEGAAMLPENGGEGL